MKPDHKDWRKRVNLSMADDIIKFFNFKYRKDPQSYSLKETNSIYRCSKYQTADFPADFIGQDGTELGFPNSEGKTKTKCLQ